MRKNKLVTCLCVTHNRVDFLRSAVTCYLNQTYKSRELLVVYNSDDCATRAYLDALHETSIYSTEVADSREITLGRMRNASLRAARGNYVAIWDDDDWHHPERISRQLEALEKTGKSACVVGQVILFDKESNEVFLSQPRGWEGTLLGRQSIIPLFADLNSKEDTPVLKELYDSHNLAVLKAPHLYVYVFHGANTCQRSHWEENLIRYAQPLPESEAQKIEELLSAEMRSK